MHLDRIDLADIHAPRAIAQAVHKQLGEIEPPVPVISIAKALDITEICTQRFYGFEGMLLTDRVRSRGSILANTKRGNRRARFTIAHELGHFLIERHKLFGPTGFLCSAQDMRETRKAQMHMRQEREANQFAINLLAPPSLFDALLSQDPELKDAQQLRDHLNVSLEAVIRHLVERRPECLAAVWSKDGHIRYWVSGDGFPWITCKRGERLSSLSVASKIVAKSSGEFSTFVDTNPIAWTNRSNIELFEQTRLSPSGHAVTLLWADVPDEDDNDNGGLYELSAPKFR
ncbi:ImmA/IrrE family metallo-endopeptidase [Sulfitobacter sp. SK011]|uniref:ImmA/IrrE family metallo-endopeptidase n=1 Tax=Sulfitobacter sp. SK011 TaxID=1389004 RepID=UPI000E0C0B93|nr:ImmA/IrrE family metallo-endopeptidase [Sulfitobacter sp. SK011]AXI41774.1 hypothetical protein C1J02_07345 [Sulfitobacter sp. SK011]